MRATTVGARGLRPRDSAGDLEKRGYALTLVDESRGGEQPVEPEGVAGLDGRDPYVNLIARPVGRTP